MLLDIVTKGATDRSVTLRIIDSGDGTPETGVVFNTSGIDLWYRREGATKTSITEASLSALDDAHSDGGFLHIGDGYYRLDLPDAAFATGANHVDVGGTVTGMVVIGGRVRLADFTLETATQPVNVTQFGGSAGTFASGRPEVNTSHIGGTLQTANDVGGDVDAILADTGTDGVVLANDAITSAKFDESTAFPLASADTGSTQVARTGADGDTLETLSDEIAVVDGNVDTLVSRITSTLFAGITSLAEWLGLLAGKQTGDATARTELRATGAGSGTYDETADSQEAIRDRGDAAWTTATTVDLNADQSGVTVGTVNALGTQAKADVNAEADAALSDIHLDHLLAATYDPASKPGAADALMNELVENDGGVSRFTANTLEEAPTGGSAPTVGEIADAVWTEPIADHSGTAGSTAEQLAAAGSAGDPWATALPGSYTSGQAGKIVGDNLNATVSSRASQTSVDDVPTNAELTAALGTLNDLSQADIRTAVGLASANLDTQLGDLPTNSELATALADADDAVLAAIAALNNLSQADVRTAVGLASANLDTQLGDLPTNSELATALASADDAVLAAIAALNNLSAAEVNAEVVDALATDTYPEPAAVPAATATLAAKINWLAALARNRITQTATTQTLRNDANTADIATASVSDDGSEFVRSKWS